jgi:predicted RecA/RadA family phage recombinase
MATNHVAGQIEAWDHVAAGDIASGGVVEMDGVTGIALVNIDTGDIGAVAVTGTFSVPKDGATAFAQGAPVEWDGAKIIAKAVGVHMGYVSDAALSADSTANVRLER